VDKSNSKPKDKIRIQFVCLGNICRSPLAEGVFRKKVEEAGLADIFEIRSSGTSDWHVGEGADTRMAETAERHGVSLKNHAARQFRKEDLEQFDHILVMDKDNLNDVLYLDTEDRYGSKVRLFREFDPSPDCFQVPDPYYGGPDGFENVYLIVERTAENLLQVLIRTYNLEVEQNS
jgi:protein-tyrosine phosphatase